MWLPKITKGSCDLTELPKTDVCVASLQCEQVIDFVFSSWSCIKNVENVYVNDYYRGRISRQQVTYDTNYDLYVNVKNVDDDFDIFESIADIMKNIKRFQINDGNIFALPQKIYQLSQATELEISNNHLTVVDLNSFSSFEMLTAINFRNNSISSLDTDTQVKSLPSRSVKTIDLSQNLLNKIPNTCFSIFTALQYLNLSHNKISSFDILTFEGVMELKTLDVSYNMLFEIGNSFTRFMNLDELFLQNNKLTKLTDYNLITLLQLKNLNLSSNMIESFENNTFKNLVMLEYLDLSNNKIEIIPKNMFEQNSNLHSVLISDNYISHVDDGAFDGKNVTKFDVRENNLTGSIEKDTFKGVHVTDLDLSGGTITSLGDEAFKFMCQDLNYLNVSFNIINSISHSAFTCSERLRVLDLSHNHIEELNFETSGLKNLLKLYVRHNSIKKITNTVYKNLVYLENLDLSHNEITEIESKSFVGLGNIETLKVTHNPFVKTLGNNTFDGLDALTSIDLSSTRTTSYKNRSFSGLPLLKYINASNGQLSSIEYDAFIQTGSIEKLDLSHNLLSVFYVNTSSISKVEEIYLNDNLIRHITNDTFSGLKLLRMLNLVDNNIQRMEAYAFKNVDKLSHLYLSSNMQMKIIGNPFINLTNLYQVNLNSVKTNFTFQSAVSIENLDMNLCGIGDLNKLSIFNVDKLRELNLSANKILKIDKFSFQSLPFLIKLDLSSNRISFIQPGSFLQVGALKMLTLFGNNLQTLQFGVFDGIKALHFVNLSSNALQSFDAKLLPVALSIALDNNDISNIIFEDFFESDINKLSIGGNPIPCKVLAELKTSKYSKEFKEVVTTASLDFHSENVDGISCQSASKSNAIVLPVANNTGYDIRPMIIQFTNAIENLRSSIETLGNNATPETSYQIKPDITKLVSSIQALVDISNQTQMKSGRYFQKMENITNATQTHLEDIKEQLINLTDKTKELKLDASDVKINQNNDGNRLVKKMIQEEIDAIREEFRNTFQNVQKHDPIPQTQVIERVDDKVLYFIAVSLGIIILLYVVNLAYGYLKREKKPNIFHNSRRTISSEMEME